jgi:phosphate-selective porin OprO/OprP
MLARLQGGRLAVAFAVVLLTTGLAHPQTSEVEELKARLEKLERQNEELRRLIRERLPAAAPAADAPTQAAPPAPEKKQVEKIVTDYLKDQDKKKKDTEDQKKKEAEAKGYDVGSDPKMTASWANGLVLQSANKDFRFHIGGRFQEDWVWWQQPLALTPDPPVGVGNLDDGIFFRRARIHIDGSAWEVLEFDCEFDFENLTSITFDEMWAGLTDLPGLGTVRFGQHSVPQGLESFSTSRASLFLERSATFDTFLQDYAPGVFASNNYLDQRLTWEAMFHRIEPVPYNGADFGDGEYAGTVRLTGLPLYQADGRYLVHLGASYQFRETKLDRTVLVAPSLNEGRDLVRFRSRPELRDAAGPQGNSFRWIDTGNLIADDVQTAGIEGLGIAGPFSVQSEAFLAHVDNAVFPANKSGTPHGNPNFWGCYAEASYYLTGENRGYDKRMGRTLILPPYTNFWWVKSDHGHCLGRGAWELLYRYSIVDLDDAGINGGILTEHTLGLNWHVNQNVRLQWNYLHANRDVVAPAHRGEVDAIGMRVLLVF